MQSASVYLGRVLQFYLDLLVQTVHREDHQSTVHYGFEGLACVADCCLVVLTHYYNYYNPPISMDPTPKLLLDYEKAKKRYQTNKTQAIEFLKASLKNPPNDNKGQVWYDYLTIKIELAGWMRDEKELEDSNAILTEVILLVKSPSIDDKIESLDLKKIKFNAFQNFAKLLIQQACQYIEKGNLQEYRKKMTGSYNYFRQAQSILLEMMQKQLKRRGFVKTQWIQWYMRYLSNVDQLLLTEFGQFKDETCMNNILKIAKTAEKIYELFKSKEDIQADIQTHLYRCYYNKAVVLRITNKPDQALPLLIKVYNYQKSNHFEEDAQKSRQQIMKVLLNKNQMNKINSYYNKSQDEQLFPIDRIKNRRQRIRKAISTPPQQIAREGKQFFQDLFADYDDKTYLPTLFTYDYELMNQLVEKVLHLFGTNTTERALLCYYMAEANYHLQQYKKSYQMITEALKIPTHDLFEVRNNKIEKVQIMAKWNPNSLEIQNLIKQIQLEINQELKCKSQEAAYQLILSQKQDLDTVKSLWVRAKSKSNDKAKYELYNEEQQRLLEQLQKMEHKYKKTVQQQKKKSRTTNFYQISSDQAGQAVNEKTKGLAMVASKQNPKIMTFNPLDDYIKKCKEKNVPQRPQVKDLLNQQNHFNPFQEMLNISIQQLQILLSTVKVQNLDLRNHHINNRLLQHFSTCADHNVIKKFKMNGVGYVQNEMLAKTISKMSQLNYLSLLDFSSHRPSNFNLLLMRSSSQRMDIEYEKPRDIIHMIYLLGSNPNSQLGQNLKVLKLKYCNVLDNHLQEMQLQNYRHLKEVSLSHNLLQGKELHRIFRLNQICAVNLSDNPLKTIDYNRWSERLSDRDFILKSLKLKNVHFNQELRYEFKYAIYRVQLLDLSQGQELSKVFEQIVSRYWQSGLQLTYLSKLIVKNVDLREIDLDKFFIVFRKLREIDFRGCKYHAQGKRYIEQIRIEELDLNIKIGDRNSQEFTFSKFQLEPMNRF